MPRVPLRSGIKDGATVLSMTAASVVFGVASQSCLAWLLGPSDRGSLAVCLTFASVLGTAFSFGTDRAIQHHTMTQRLTAAQAVNAVLIIAVLGSVLATAVGWSLVDSSLAFFDKADAKAFRFSLLWVPILVANHGLTMLLQAQRRFAFRGALELLDTAARLVFVTVMVYVLNLGIGGALFAVVLASLGGLLLRLAGFWRFALSLAGVPWAKWRPVISYGARHYPASLGHIVNARIGLIVLGFIAGQEEIGFFVAATVLTDRMLMIPDAMNIALLPRLTAESDPRADLVAQVGRFSIVSVGLGLICLLSFSRVLVPLLFSPAFRPAILLLWFMAPGILAHAAAKPLMSYFLATNRPGVISTATTSRSVCDTLILVAFYPGLGIPAAALAATAGNVVALTLLAVAFHRATTLPLRDVWAWRPADSALLRNAASELYRRATA